MTTRAQYTPGTGAEKTEQFFDSLNAQAKKGNQDDAVSAVLDSVKNESGVSLPPSVEKIVAELSDKDAKIVLDAVAQGYAVYEREHGTMPTADVIEAALAQGFAASQDPRKLLDSIGNTAHHDQLAAQPNRVVVAVTAAIAEAIPFATYLPADISSNEARLGIVSHTAGSTFGGYDANTIMDGVNIGEDYFSSERLINLGTNGGAGPLTGQFFTRYGGSTGMQVLRNRTIVYINGFPSAFSSQVNSAGATESISGVSTIAGTDYAISGTVTIATGAISISSSPALPANTVIDAEAYVDYEANTALTPEVVTGVQIFQLFAAPWRAKSKQTIDSKGQYQNEIGMDLLSESVIAMRNQVSNERHYKTLRKGLALAKAVNQSTFNFDYATQIAQKSRVQIWLSLQTVLGAASQKMAEDTMDHGITHLYVTRNILADFQGMPSDMWQPSGLANRPGIFRAGRLFGLYDVYYTPKVLTAGSTTGQILGFGRSTQVARNPFVLGDAIPPTFMPLAFNDDMRYGTGFYGRNFTSVNPHAPSSKGVALVNVTNLA